MSLLYIVILGFALFFAMQLINRLAVIIPGESRWRNLLLRSLPLAEFVVWLTYAFWAADIVFQALPYRGIVQSAMALVLMIALGWYVLRDFLSGVLLKSESGFKKGQSIKTNFVSGKISAVGYRTLMIETEKGEKVRIPFSKLGDAIITTPVQKGQSHSHMLKLPLPEGSNPGSLTGTISKTLLNMPWIIAEEEPLVSFVHDEAGKLLLEVRFSVLKEEHALLVKHKLQELIEEKNQ
ncbi:MAG: mechanosensitive ion channel [Bacteroidales bacterium]|nr:mechanosensitive ion channel [Bacteroidales bacterium]